MKVLLLEDNADDSTIMKKWFELTFSNCAFFLANDGMDAFVIARREKPDVMILDIMIKTGLMSGEDLLRRMSVDKELKDVPVILASCLSEIYLQRLMTSFPQVRGFEQKPISFGNLKEKINQIMWEGNQEESAEESLDTEKT